MLDGFHGVGGFGAEPRTVTSVLIDRKELRSGETMTQEEEGKSAGGLDLRPRGELVVWRWPGLEASCWGRRRGEG